MKLASLLLLTTLASCMGGPEKEVKEFLTTNMKLQESNLEIDSITIGEKVHATETEKKNMVLLGLKDSVAQPLTVTFKVKEDCVAVAEAIQNDVIFNEKKVSCRSVKAGEKPNTKFVKQYNFGAWGRRIAVYEEGKVLKAGDKFTAKGQWIQMTTLKDETKKAPLFQGLE